MAQILPRIKKRPEEISDEETALDGMRLRPPRTSQKALRESNNTESIINARRNVGGGCPAACATGDSLMYVLVIGDVKIGSCEFLTVRFMCSCANASIYYLL